MCPSVGTSSPLPNTSVLLPLLILNPKVLAKPQSNVMRHYPLVQMHPDELLALRNSSSVENIE